MFTLIQLDKARNLRYGMKAISLIEKELKKNIGKIDLSNLTMEEVAIFIWSGLYHEDETLTPDKVMDLVDDYSNVQTVSKAMQKAIAESFGGNADTDTATVDEDNDEKNG